MRNVLAAAKRYSLHAFIVLLAITGAVAFEERTQAQTSSPTLVDSIITSTETDKPPRFCWVQEYKGAAGDPDSWKPIEDTKARGMELDDFRGGGSATFHLDISPYADRHSANLFSDHGPRDYSHAYVFRIPRPDIYRQSRALGESHRSQLTHLADRNRCRQPQWQAHARGLRRSAHECA